MVCGDKLLLYKNGGIHFRKIRSEPGIKHIIFNIHRFLFPMQQLVYDFFCTKYCLEFWSLNIKSITLKYIYIEI